MTHKKNRFLTFCASLIPGAGEMYMGFMKMGVSLMGLFMVVFAAAVTLNFSALLFILAIIWFYSFFHVNNLAGLPEEEFYTLEDDYLFHLTDGNKTGADFIQVYKKPIAVTLILAGVIILWQGFVHMLYGMIPDYLYRYTSSFTNSLPKMAAGAGIIVLGFFMIRGKKKEIEKEAEADGKSNDGQTNG